MKKNRINVISISLAVFLFTVSGFSQQLNDLNHYYAESQSKLSQAKAALDSGDYDRSAELSEEAKTLAGKADQFNFVLIMKYRAYGYKVNAEYQMKKAGYFGPATNLIIRDDFSNSQTEYDNGNALFPGLDTNEDLPASSNNGILAVQHYSNSYEFATVAANNGNAIYLLGLDVNKWKANADAVFSNASGKNYSSNANCLDLFTKASNAYSQGNALYSTLALQSNFTEGAAVYRQTIDAYSNATLFGAEAVDLLLNTDKFNDAQKLYRYASKRLGEAKQSPQAEVYKDKLSDASTNLVYANKALVQSNYNQSMDYSDKVIKTLDELGLGTVFPRYYRVRLIPDNRDSLFKIAAYQFVYKNGEKWHVIYEANKKFFTNGRSENRIEPGELYTIPDIAGEKREGEYQAGNQYPVFDKAGKVKVKVHPQKTKKTVKKEK